MKKVKRVRIMVHRGHDRTLVFDEESDAHQECQLRKRAEAKMGKGLAVMSISRFDGNNNGKKGGAHE